MPPKGVLTPLQEEFLRLFFGEPGSDQFYLTGGTALAGYYLGHRFSEDLDLFTHDQSALAAIAHTVEKVCGRLGLTAVPRRHLPTLIQFTLEGKGNDPLKLDIVQDVPVRFGLIQNFDTVRVDSLDNIAVNKVSAILSRTEIKDFVDLYFLLKAGYRLEELIPKAQQKDGGLTPFYLAGQLLNVKNFSRLPRMISPLQLPELQEQLIREANSILDQLNPDKGMDRP